MSLNDIFCKKMLNLNCSLTRSLNSIIISNRWHVVVDYSYLVQAGVNSTIYQVKNSDTLYKALKIYINNPVLRWEHGTNGLDWAKQFSQENIWNGINKLYKS